MKFLLTIYLHAGSINLFADNENAARITLALFIESGQAQRGALHRLDDGGYVDELLYEAEATS